MFFIKKKLYKFDTSNMKIFFQTFSITTKLISILLLFIFTQSCSKESPCNNYTSQTFSYKLSENNKNQIPFKGSDTLRYISNIGDTAILIGQGKNNYILNSKIRVSNNPACPEYDNYSNEFVDIKYKGTNSNLFEIFVSYYNENPFGDELTTVYLNRLNTNYEGYYGFYNDMNRYIHIVNIGSNTVSGVLIADDISKDPFFIYNKYYGILQITLDSNTVYTLNQ